MRSDQDLVDAMLTGDSAAFDELFARHAPAVRNRLLRMVRDAAAADDLVQEVFLRLWTRAEQWQGTAPLSRWLTKMATNLALNHLRSQRRHPAQPLQPIASVAEDDQSDRIPASLVDAASLGPDALYEQAEERQLLQALIRTLPDAQREVLSLMLEQQLEVSQIASALGIAPGTVKSRLHYARRSLAQHWHESAGDEP
jgi:RNA polymerase sigma-70 factor (ECF subfamily)